MASEARFSHVAEKGLMAFGLVAFEPNGSAVTRVLLEDLVGNV